MNNLLLVGAGQLGSRYLQGLAKGDRGLNITVVDCSEQALATSRARWADAGGEASAHIIRWLQHIPHDLTMVDLVIIVTSSQGRAEIVAKLAHQVQIKYWILEKVLAQSSDELHVILNATSHAKGCWVNTPRRLMRWHQRLKERFGGEAPLRMTQCGNLWGLACNSIHFIDLMAWWTGEELISIDTHGLDKDWFESKRLGYYEITGELVATFSRGSVLTLVSREDATAQGLRVETSSSQIWQIDERSGQAMGPDANTIDGYLEYQSNLTAPLVNRILTQGDCELPTLAESIAMHEIFLDAMLSHWNLTQRRQDRTVPIT